MLDAQDEARVTPATSPQRRPGPREEGWQEHLMLVLFVAPGALLPLVRGVPVVEAVVAYSFLGTFLGAVVALYADHRNPGVRLGVIVFRWFTIFAVAAFVVAILELLLAAV